MNYKETKEGKYTVLTGNTGDKSWWLNGKRHRTDGPAMEWIDGSKEWFLNNKRHRVDGPAIEWGSGHKEWWLKDKLVYSDFENKLKDYPNLSESFKKSIIKYELQRT